MQSDAASRAPRSSAATEQRRVLHALRCRITGTTQQRRHIAVAWRLEPQRKHVHKVADQPLGAGGVAPVVRRADHHLVLTRVPAQQQPP